MDTLIKLGDWSINALDGSSGVGAQHSCHNLDEVNNSLGEYVYSWVRGDTSAVCFHCNTPVPDEVQTLVHLCAK